MERRVLDSRDIGGTAIRPCKVTRLMDLMTPEDRKVFETALADKSLSHYRLEMELRARGVMVTNDTLKFHRLGVCGCGVS